MAIDRVQWPSLPHRVSMCSNSTGEIAMSITTLMQQVLASYAAASSGADLAEYG
ncbi:MAG: hypothetical protein WC953_04215 [Pseudomonas sp.]